jgi:hypothetical protein
MLCTPSHRIQCTALPAFVLLVLVLMMVLVLPVMLF